MPNKLNVFKEPGYLAHNKARQDHLASLGLTLNNKRVLELGAGVGDHTQFFLDRGCTVTVTDGRRESVDFMRKEHPDWDVRLLDITEDDPSCLNISFDVIYCYGLLYHCSNWRGALLRMMKVYPKLLLLETCVSPSDEKRGVEENKDDPRCSIYGIGCRPKRFELWYLLKHLFKYVYIPKTQPDHDEFPLDWNNSPNGECRSVFIGSIYEIDNPNLSPDFLTTQTRYAHTV